MKAKATRNPVCVRVGFVLTGISAAIPLLIPSVRVQAQESRQVPSPGSAVRVALPPHEKPVYSLDELSTAMTKASSHPYQVDGRCGKRHLLLVLPRTSATSPSATVSEMVLKRLIAEATGLRWRVVGDTQFLSYHDGSDMEKAAQERTNELNKLRDSVTSKLAKNAREGAFPISANDFATPVHQWDSLNSEQRERLLELAGLASGASAEQLRTLFQTQNHLTGGKVGFQLDLVVTGHADGFEGSAAHSLIH